MLRLLIVGGGLFGSHAAALARHHGIEAVVFDAQMPGAASPAAAGLFKEAWAGKKYQEHFRVALPILDQLFGIRRITLLNDAATPEPFLFVPPSAILEREPVRERVSAVGNGWVETAGQRHEGIVYVAAGVWCAQLLPELTVQARSGSAFLFQGSGPGRYQQLGHGRQALAFERDPGTTYFSDGTAELSYTTEHERASLARAVELKLTGPPVQRLHGHRPYTAGGPLFKQIAERTWVGTGGRKMGTIFGAYFATQLLAALTK